MAGHDERGAALGLSLITVAALMGLGAMTLRSVQVELSQAGQERFTETALYAAESGVAAGIEFLRGHCDASSRYGAWVSPGNTSPVRPAAVLGNGAAPGTAGNVFSSDAWYEVIVLNNREDSGFDAGTDEDGIVVLRAVGHGPDDTVAAVQAEVANPGCLPALSVVSWIAR